MENYRPINTKAWNQGSFYQWAGIEIIEAHAGEVRLVLHVQDHHRGGGGTQAINGGIVAYMFDALLGTCAGTVWDENTIGQVTITLNIQYLAMLQAEKQVVGVAHVTKRGKATVFMTGEIYDEQGEVCASCTGIYRLRQKK
ncbi:MAG: PaaI family thioesterase [Microscillaceae bacterium]|jgi:uncharacterized protein (TIGR00369 family)|nr:PaaI family thioesterase [Microscillaceae bacterium]